MDPVSSLVGVVTPLALALKDYFGEKRYQNSLKISDFKEWCLDNKHEDILKQIQSSHETSVFIKALLVTELPSISDQIDASIDKLSKEFDAKLESFLRQCQINDLPLVDKYEETISEQAVELLQAICKTQDGYFQLSQTHDGLNVILNSEPNFSPREPQFLHEDLARLTELGYLLPVSGRSDHYRTKRKAFDLVKAWN